MESLKRFIVNRFFYNGGCVKVLTEGLLCLRNIYPGAFLIMQKL